MMNYKFTSIKQKQNKSIQLIADNYTEFINYFFDTLWYECDLPNNFGVDKSFNTEKLKDYFTNKTNINNVLISAVNYKIDVEKEPLLNETMFFYPLRAYLYHFSKILANENQLLNYKGH